MKRTAILSAYVGLAVCALGLTGCAADVVKRDTDIVAFESDRVTLTEWRAAFRDEHYTNLSVAASGDCDAAHEGIDVRVEWKRNTSHRAYRYTEEVGACDTDEYVYARSGGKSFVYSKGGGNAPWVKDEVAACAPWDNLSCVFGEILQIPFPADRYSEFSYSASDGGYVARNFRAAEGDAGMEGADKVVIKFRDGYIACVYGAWTGYDRPCDRAVFYDIGRTRVKLPDV